MIKFRCTDCTQKMGVPDEYAGKAVRCPRCKARVAVPLPEPEPLPAVDEIPMEVVDEAPDDGLGPLDLASIEPPAVQPGNLRTVDDRPVCDACGKHYNPGAAICVHCGAPLKKGFKKQKTQVLQEAGAADGDADENKPLSSYLIRLAAAAAVGLIFTGIWLGVVKWTGYELGFLAWALGGAVGFAAGIEMKNQPAIYGAAAAGIAFLSIAAAKGVMFWSVFTGSNFLGIIPPEFEADYELRYYAVMMAMADNGELNQRLTTHAQADLAYYFDDPQADALLDAVPDEGYFEDAMKLDRQVERRVEGMTPEQLDAAKSAALARYPQFAATYEDAAVFSGGGNTFNVIFSLLATVGLFDLLWMVLAVGTAYGVAMS
ncbi:MAG: hypothetical protein AAGB29_01220 [Planctomycetota bacterium]